MRLFEKYDETHKCFAEGKQKDNNTNEAQKHLQLHDLGVGEHLADKYALWLYFRMIDDNSLHRTGRRIENALEGITLQIEKKAESARNLDAYIYLIMDTQLNIKGEKFDSALYQVTKMFIKELHTALFVAPTGVGKAHLALDLFEKEYINHFNYIEIICPMLRHNERYRSREWFLADPHIISIEPGNHLFDWIKMVGNEMPGSKTLFLVDDIIADEKLDKRRQPLLELAMLGRHRGHLLWLLMQAYTAVPIGNRRQAKMLYVWFQKKQRDWDAVYKENEVIKMQGEIVNVKERLRQEKHTCLIMRVEQPFAYEIR